MKVELFKNFCQFRTKDFRQHGDNIQAAIHLDEQDFALFTNGSNLVLSFTDNEGEATNMCMVHIDPNERAKKEVILAPHMWRITLQCSPVHFKVTTNDGCDVTKCFDINSKTIYLGMDPDSNVATKWTDVKHPKMGLVLRVAKPKANTSLFKEILEDRLLTEHGSTEDLEQRLKRLKGFEKGYLGLHAVQLKAVIGDAMDKSSLLRDNDEVAGKMKGIKLMPESAIHFEMECKEHKWSFKPNMVDAQLVNGEGEVVRNGLSVVVSGKLGYIRLPDELPGGSFTVRLVKPINGHPADVLEVKSFFIETADDLETKKRKVIGSGLSSQVQNSHDRRENHIQDIGNNAHREPSKEELEHFEDLMNIIGNDQRTLNSAVLESDGHTFNSAMPPSRVNEIKIVDKSKDGTKLSKTNAFSKGDMWENRACSQSSRSSSVTLPKVLNKPHYEWIMYLIFGAVITLIALLLEAIRTMRQDYIELS